MTVCNGKFFVCNGKLEMTLKPVTGNSIFVTGNWKCLILETCNGKPKMTCNGN